MRLSIDVTPDQHKRLKAAAALQGQSIKDYVLEHSLPRGGEAAALQELEAFMKPRMEAAQEQDFSSCSVDDIFSDVVTENRSK